MRVLVTGAQGFLGRALCQELARAGHRVVAGCRRAAPELEAEGCEVARIDLADAASLARAAAGCDGVIHAAAKAGYWGPRAEYLAVNRDGTANAIEACRRARVPRLVFTSSPSVCFDGTDHRRASNDLPYAKRFLSPYPESKALAEQLVLAANGTGLATTALRPHLIVGPGDPHLLPRLVDRARRGRLVQVGDGSNEVSLTWVGNAALAHRLALEQLEPGAVHSGRAYFVAQRDPVLLWPWIRGLLGRMGIAFSERRLPTAVAWAAGTACEGIWRTLSLQSEPPMTRFLAQVLARSHSYDVGPLERDLGYRETFSMDDVSERLGANPPSPTR